VFINAVYGVMYRSVCVGTGGLCSPGCGRGVCSGVSWWRFKVLGLCVFVIKSVRRLWMFIDDGRMYLKCVELRIHQ
jgi:hypothetical protein